MIVIVQTRGFDLGVISRRIAAQPCPAQTSVSYFAEMLWFNSVRLRSQLQGQLQQQCSPGQANEPLPASLCYGKLQSSSSLNVSRKNSSLLQKGR